MMNYPSDEIGLKNRIDELNARWEAACPDGFLSYGFYPYYTKQKYRILFVGREAHSMSYDDYIQVKYKDYINASGDTNGNFHRRIFYLTYGLLNDFPEFAIIPHSSDIAKGDFAHGRLSFAFMNVSTIGNETGDTNTQWPEYEKSNKDGQRFRKEMIEILAPNIIVCAYCGWDITQLADRFESLESSELVTTEQLFFGSISCLRFDTYHWCATNAPSVGGLNDEDGFYNPLRDAFRKFRHLLK
ncbi:MAG: hypothetical protein GX577_14155 [Leptolinea sp.]|jgi:hypothetical protein|nr:hypothetical protein [Leptolinea sp.]OQA30528.1 MAG: hypothetical protein BWY57_02800 [Betaproteobacteria bacterium ADurb.Bin341]